MNLDQLYPSIFDLILKDLDLSDLLNLTKTSKKLLDLVENSSIIKVFPKNKFSDFSQYLLQSLNVIDLANLYKSGLFYSRLNRTRNWKKFITPNLYIYWFNYQDPELWIDLVKFRNLEFRIINLLNHLVSIPTIINNPVSDKFWRLLKILPELKNIPKLEDLDLFFLDLEKYEFFINTQNQGILEENYYFSRQLTISGKMYRVGDLNSDQMIISGSLGKINYYLQRVEEFSENLLLSGNFFQNFRRYDEKGVYKFFRELRRILNTKRKGNLLVKYQDMIKIVKEFFRIFNYSRIYTNYSQFTPILSNKKKEYSYWINYDN